MATFIRFQVTINSLPASSISSHLLLHFSHVCWLFLDNLAYSNLLNDAAGLLRHLRCGGIKNVIIWSAFHKPDLALFSLAKYKCENYNLLRYQQFKMFCLDPVSAIGYQHSSWFCFSWLLVYYPQLHSLNLCLETI